MSTDYTADVARYTKNVNEAAVVGIVKHLGIALRSKDATLVSCSSKEELARVRDGWLKKKLGLTDEDEVLDAAIQEVCTAMKGDRSKHRVTFCYLLAEKFSKLDSLA